MASSPEHLHELFSQIGTRLKTAREGRHLTLQEISARTRINLSFLQKIEQGDLQGLPSLTFVRGFIRNYVEALELDDEALEEDLRQLHETPLVNDEAHRIEQAPVNILDTTVERPPMGRIAVWIGVGVLAVVAGFLLLRIATQAPETAQGPEPAAEEQAAVTEDATEPPAADTTEPATGGPEPVEPAVTAPAPGEGGGSSASAPDATASVPEVDSGSPTGGGGGISPPPGGSGQPPAGGSGSAAPPTASVESGDVGPVEGRQRLELTLRGLEPTWVRMSIDRAPPIDVHVQEGETVGWEAEHEIRLTIGKSDGVTVNLNGEEIILPQEDGRLIPDITLNRLTLLRLEN